MKGTLEVIHYKSTGDKDVILKEDNMIVDGAKEHLVDIFTRLSPPSGEGDQLGNYNDVSNVGVKAMSLGPAKGGFKSMNTRAARHPMGLSPNATVYSTTIQQMNPWTSINNRAYSIWTQDVGAGYSTPNQYWDGVLSALAEVPSGVNISPCYYTNNGSFGDTLPSRFRPGKFDVLEDVDIQSVPVVHEEEHQLLTFDITKVKPNNQYMLEFQVRPPYRQEELIPFKGDIAETLYRVKQINMDGIVKYLNPDTLKFDTKGKHTHTLTYSTGRECIVDDFFRLGYFPLDLLTFEGPCHYYLELLVPNFIHVRNTFKGCKLLNLTEGGFIKNPDIYVRDSYLVNGDFNDFISPDPNSKDLELAEKAGVAAFTGWTGPNYVNNSLNPEYDIDRVGSVLVSAIDQPKYHSYLSSIEDPRIDTAAGYACVLTASSTDLTSSAASYIQQTITLPDKFTNPDVEKDFWKNRVIYLSFWQRPIKWGSLGTKVTLKDETTGKSYNFDGDYFEEAPAATRHNAWGDGSPFWASSTVQNDKGGLTKYTKPQDVFASGYCVSSFLFWEFFSRGINITPDMGGHKLTVTFQALENHNYAVTQKIGKVALASVTLGPLPGWEHGYAEAGGLLHISNFRFYEDTFNLESTTYAQHAYYSTSQGQPGYKLGIFTTPPPGHRTATFEDTGIRRTFASTTFKGLYPYKFYGVEWEHNNQQRLMNKSSTSRKGHPGWTTDGYAWRYCFVRNFARSTNGPNFNLMTLPQFSSLNRWGSSDQVSHPYVVSGELPRWGRPCNSYDTGYHPPTPFREYDGRDVCVPITSSVVIETPVEEGEYEFDLKTFQTHTNRYVEPLTKGGVTVQAIDPEHSGDIYFYNFRDDTWEIPANDPTKKAWLGKFFKRVGIGEGYSAPGEPDLDHSDIKHLTKWNKKWKNHKFSFHVNKEGRSKYPFWDNTTSGGKRTVRIGVFAQNPQVHTTSSIVTVDGVSSVVTSSTATSAVTPLYVQLNSITGKYHDKQSWLYYCTGGYGNEWVETGDTVRDNGTYGWDNTKQQEAPVIGGKNYPDYENWKHRLFYGRTANRNSTYTASHVRDHYYHNLQAFESSGLDETSEYDLNVFCPSGLDYGLSRLAGGDLTFNVYNGPTDISKWRDSSKITSEPTVDFRPEHWEIRKGWFQTLHSAPIGGDPHEWLKNSHTKGETYRLRQAPNFWQKNIAAAGSWGARMQCNLAARSGGGNSIAHTPALNHVARVDEMNITPGEGLAVITKANARDKRSDQNFYFAYSAKRPNGDILHWDGSSQTWQLGTSSVWNAYDAFSPSSSGWWTNISKYSNPDAGYFGPRPHIFSSTILTDFTSDTLIRFSLRSATPYSQGAAQYCDLQNLHFYRIVDKSSPKSVGINAKPTDTSIQPKGHLHEVDSEGQFTNLAEFPQVGTSIPWASFNYGTMAHIDETSWGRYNYRREFSKTRRRAGHIGGVEEKDLRFKAVLPEYRPWPHEELLQRSSWIPCQGYIFPSSTDLKGWGELSTVRLNGHNNFGCITSKGYVLENIDVPRHEVLLQDSLNGFTVSAAPTLVSSIGGTTSSFTLGPNIYEHTGNVALGFSSLSSTEGRPRQDTWYHSDAYGHVGIFSRPGGAGGKQLRIFTGPRHQGNPFFRTPFATIDPSGTYYYSMWLKSSVCPEASGLSDVYSHRVNIKAADVSGVAEGTTTVSSLMVSSSSRWEREKWFQVSGLIDMPELIRDAPAGRFANLSAIAFSFKPGESWSSEEGFEYDEKIVGSELYVDKIEVRQLLPYKPKVTYSLSLPYAQWKHMNDNCGGVGAIGLWTIDEEKTTEKLGDLAEAGVPWLQTPSWNSSFSGTGRGEFYNLPKNGYTFSSMDRAGMIPHPYASIPYGASTVNLIGHTLSGGGMTAALWCKFPKHNKQLYADSLQSQSTATTYLRPIMARQGYFPRQTSSVFFPASGAYNVEFLSGTGGAASASNWHMGVSAVNIIFNKQTPEGHSVAGGVGSLSQFCSGTAGVNGGKQSSMLLGFTKDHDIMCYLGDDWSSQQGSQAEGEVLYALDGSGVSWQTSAIVDIETGEKKTGALFDSSAWVSLYLERPEVSAVATSAVDKRHLPPRAYIHQEGTTGLSAMEWRTDGGGAYNGKFFKNEINYGGDTHGTSYGAGCAIASLDLFGATGLSIAEISALGVGGPATVMVPTKAMYSFDFGNHVKHSMGEDNTLHPAANAYAGGAAEGPEERITKVLYAHGGAYAHRVPDMVYPHRKTSRYSGVECSAIYVNFPEDQCQTSYDGNYDPDDGAWPAGGQDHQLVWAEGCAALDSNTNAAYSGCVATQGYNFYYTDEGPGKSRPQRNMNFWMSQGAKSWDTLQPFEDPSVHRYYLGNDAADYQYSPGMGNFSVVQQEDWHHIAVTISVPDASGFRAMTYWVDGQPIRSVGKDNKYGVGLTDNQTHDLWVPCFVNTTATFFYDTPVNTGSYEDYPLELNTGVHRITLWSGELEWDDISREYNAGYGANPKGSNSYIEQRVVVDWLFNSEHATFDAAASSAYLAPAYSHLANLGMIEGDDPHVGAGMGAGGYMKLSDSAAHGFKWNVRDWALAFEPRTTRNSQGHPFKLYNLTHQGGSYEPEFKLFAKKVFGPGGVQMPADAKYDDIITFSWTLNL